ncbi:DUF5110 domain-containing protein [Streptomyces antibioticus]|uniref:DUF5110 domain-containing protein n=1 Tax=Streptomyces antibioticus TaxID=1890 RepID=UPI00367EBA58
MPHDAHSPLDKVSLTVAAGDSGTSSLYEDDGHSAPSRRAATTRIRHAEHGGAHVLTIGPAKGTFKGRASRRRWTVSFTGVERAPRQMTVQGARLSASAWKWDADTHTLRVTLPAHGVREQVTVRNR